MPCLLWLVLLLSALPAQAGSYNYRDDIFSWESSSNAIRDQDWDGDCTNNPGDEDKTTVSFSNGFKFPFNGSSYGSVRVFINGTIQFGPDVGAQRSNANTALPMAATSNRSGCPSGVPGGMLLVYWSDMQVQASALLGLGAGTVSWEQKGSAPNRYVVISWTNVYKPSFLGALFAKRYSFQVILYENGEFKYQYTSASTLLGTSFNADGSDATIGVQVNGGDTTQYLFQQSFNAAGSNAVWTEVGQGTLSATISNYLGTGMDASGASAATATFVPHHFDVSVTPACSAFSYAGQPFAATVTARNGLANATTTSNYDGSGALVPAYAQAGAYSAAQAIGAGAFTPSSVPANAFRNGVATVNTLSYAYVAKLTAPGSLYVRVTDPSGVSSANGSEAGMVLRSGRLQLSSNSGSEKRPLDLPLQAQYWTGAAWVLNPDDSCTVVPGKAIVLFNPLTLKGTISTALNNSAVFSLANGLRKLTIAPASPVAAGSLDVGLNLGSTGNAQLCSAAAIPAIPTSTGAQLPWLRSQNGSVGNCGAAWDRDPAARATFGVIGADTGKLIDVRIPF
ncbi:MAG TPA: DUF6701 domain-containing protein [Burkholderiaceae bacterium]|jgi:hypothetical protein